jgi:preprotein translocase subunit SecF
MGWLSPKRKINFVAFRSIAAFVSVLSVLTSLVLFVMIGPSWGIDFTGGTEMHLKFKEDVQILELRSALTELGLSDDSVQQIGEVKDLEFVVRIQDPDFGADEIRDNVLSSLQKKFGDDWIKESFFDSQIGARVMVVYNGDPVGLSEVQSALSSITDATAEKTNDDNKIYIKVPGLSSKIAGSLKQKFPGKQKYTDSKGETVGNLTVLQVDSVGPKVGAELQEQGFISIMATLALILVYVAFRFNLSFAPGAVLALFHDVTIVIGAFVLFDILGWKHEFNLPMIGALLTIIGYSLNDTIVIYDRIRENMTRYRRMDLNELINDSINETLGRTLATSLTTLMGMSAFLIFGGPVIQTFALAIFLGVIVGTYSTVFVASPTILVMQDLQPYLGKLFSPLVQDDESGDDSEEASQSEMRRRERAEKQNKANS